MNEKRVTAMNPDDEEISAIVARAERRIQEWNRAHGHGRGPLEPHLISQHIEIILLRDLCAAITALRLRAAGAQGVTDGNG